MIISLAVGSGIFGFLSTISALATFLDLCFNQVRSNYDDIPTEFNDIASNIKVHKQYGKYEIYIYKFSFVRRF